MSPYLTPFTYILIYCTSLHIFFRIWVFHLCVLFPSCVYFSMFLFLNSSFMYTPCVLCLLFSLRTLLFRFQGLCLSVRNCLLSILCFYSCSVENVSGHMPDYRGEGKCEEKCAWKRWRNAEEMSWKEPGNVDLRACFNPLFLSTKTRKGICWGP